MADIKPPTDEDLVVRVNELMDGYIGFLKRYRKERPESQHTADDVFKLWVVKQLATLQLSLEFVTSFVDNMNSIIGNPEVLRLYQEAKKVLDQLKTQI